MWSISEIKIRAKKSLKNYYWHALIVTLLTGFLSMSGGSGGVSAKKTEFNDAFSGGQRGSDMPWEFWAGILVLILVVALLIFVVSIVFSTFVGNAVIVGKCRFFIESREKGSSAGIGTAFYAFGSGNYLNIIKTMFLKNLFVFLWSLLFVIPGIIKSYEYFMVPYIMAEEPSTDYHDAFELSRKMMAGNKMHTFLLSLSFIGWYILGFFACCIGTIFVAPYPEAAMAELYSVLKNSNYSYQEV